MAKAKGGGQRRNDPAPDTNEAVLDLTGIETGEQLDSALEKVFSEIGSDGSRSANVYVYKILPEDAKEARVWNGAPSDYDLDSIAKRFGSGDYRVKVYITGDTGRMGLAPGGNKVLSMLLDPAEDERIRRQREGTPAAVAQPGGLTRDDLIAAIRAAMPQPAPAPSINPIEMVSGLAGIVAKLVPQRDERPQFDPMNMLRMVAEVVRDARKGGEDDEDGPRRGNSNSNDIWITLINKFGPLFAEAMAQRGGVGAVPSAGQPVVVPGGAVVPFQPVPAAPAPNQPAMENDAVRGLTQGLQFLVMHAERNSDPETYADLILDMVPDAELKQMLDAPDWLARLTTFCPDVAKYEKWFTELRTILLEDLNAPPVVEPSKDQPA